MKKLLKQIHNPYLILLMVEKK
ncbi:hypothetical protein [Aquimarina longa]